MKSMFNFRKVVILFLLVFVSLSFSKTKVNIDGNINIRIRNDSKSINYGNKKSSSIGNVDDEGYLYRPFIINNKMYILIKDQYNYKYVIQTIFWNNNISSSIYSENAYKLNRHSNNCLSLDGDDNYCFTITAKGYPALYNRMESRYEYIGYFIKQYNKNYKNR